MKLNNGVEIPQIGIGTYKLTPIEAENSVAEAIKIGYRLIDTANAYVNERAVGRGIKKSGVQRRDIFVSTKLWPSEYENPFAVDETLERLGLDYVDLLFIHQPSGNYFAGYAALERALKEGKTRAIGLSNFEGKYLGEIFSSFKTVPQVIQVEAHPYYTQKVLREQIAEKDVKLMSWYPLGHGDAKLLSEPVLWELGRKYGKTAAQIVLRWHVDMGFIVIPGSKNKAHIADNFKISDFSLDGEDLAKIALLDKDERYYIRTDEHLKMFAAIKPKYETN